MNNIFIDEISFDTDIMPLFYDFEDLESKLKARFNETKEQSLILQVSGHVVKDSKINRVSDLAKYIESCISTGKNVVPGFIDGEAFNKRSKVDYINYRFVTTLKGDEELTVLRITPKYKKGLDLWNSMVALTTNLFQQKNKKK